MTLDKEARRRLARDTIDRSPSIVADHKHQGASADSTFINSQLPPLDPLPDNLKSAHPVEIVNSDAFTLSRKLLADDPKGKVAVLNLASDILPAGPWLQLLTTTQEEALCYSSTLYITLKKEYYPWPNLGPGCVAGVFSSGVVIFRDDLDHECVELANAERRVVSVITVAAPARPELMADKTAFAKPETLVFLQEKIRLIYRIAGRNGQEYLVLGAMGCGAYGCPPRVVATQMRDILLEPEFAGRFKRVVFAVYSRPGSGPGNFEVFTETFNGVEV
ncbi:hypothetical protein MIND_00824900 [Mycena indigotica]|uniref:Microbial-type PARG catalytic domain-containing protein n=1 Tax=Mycena indigotica TaxID=2126181 RepID=A0A8H6W211_9AGAR|nr:uncharacterized protein MIND_00824900 [Mycena indigotica]KAF7298773.1 hypothetical protein MIND_00824900 [Mycena indigotica]